MTARLGIGTATFLPGYGLTTGGAPESALLSRALDLGVDYIDTAAGYGESEAALGAIASEVTRLQARVCTKFSGAALSSEAFETAARLSLSKMHLSAVDTLMLHSVSGSTLGAPALAAAWQGVREHSLAARLGASTYGVDDARLAAGAPWCTAIQVEYSLLNQSVVRTLTAPKRAGLEIVVRSVLCKGLLTDAALGLSLPADAAATLHAIAGFARSLGMSVSTLAIRFAIDTPGVDVVLVGIGSAAELDDAVAAWRRAPLSPAEWAEVASFDRGDADWSHPERWPGGRLAS